MTRRKLVGYAAAAVAVAAAAFALRDRLARRRRVPWRSNGHAAPERLELTAEEVRA